ncbi:MAG: ATPase [Cytophagales bacterium]|nr:MAG: ATPase [Cytophagales bacterium]
MDNTNSDTSNFLNWVEIKNFKSIKDLRLDCKRVNIFIGKPNVGKSNILEGLGMLGEVNSQGRIFEGYIRYENLTQLFYDNDPSKSISIDSNNRLTELYQKPNIGNSFNHFGYTINHLGSTYRLSERGEVVNIIPIDETPFSHTKKYDFSNLTIFSTIFQDFLLPPNGQNLYSVIRRNKELWTEFATLFQDQNLELVLYDEKQEFILQKRQERVVWQYPYFSIADTFRRYMFYIAAIESNKNSVIIFEEPEVHSFPPYTKALAHRIAYSEQNQFFISTHSPYLLQTLIAELDDADLSVYITYYKDYQTQVRLLTAEELQEALDLSIDLFYNLSRYESNA